MDCDECEQVMQPFLDRELSDAERALAERHLDDCSYCRRRYRFEVELRRFVRQATAEPMDPGLRERLASLRIAL